MSVSKLTKSNELIPVLIAFVITRSVRGGAQSHVLELLKRIVPGYSVLITGEDGFLVEAARQLGIEVFILQSMRQDVSPINDVAAVAELIRLFRKLRPTVVHAHSSKAGIIARVAARILNIPSIFTAHGWAFTDGASLGRKALSIPSEIIAGRLSTAIITVSRNDENLAHRFWIRARAGVQTIHNGVPSEVPRANPTHEPPILTMVARLDRQKDPELVLRAVADVRKDFQLWFIGDGPLRQKVEATTRALRLEHRTRFWGTRSDVPELLGKSQLFVLASEWEGLPISILEAMAAGLPVVATDVGGVRELVVDGETGRLVKKGSVDAMRSALQSFIENPALRAQCGSRGRLEFETKFTADVMVQKTLSVYLSIMDVPSFQLMKSESAQ